MAARALHVCTFITTCSFVWRGQPRRTQHLVDDYPTGARVGTRRRPYQSKKINRYICEKENRKKNNWASVDKVLVNSKKKCTFAILFEINGGGSNVQHTDIGPATGNS